MSKRNGKSNGKNGGPPADKQVTSGAAPQSEVAAPSPDSGGATPASPGSGMSKLFFGAVLLGALVVLGVILIKGASSPRLARLTIFSSGHTLGYLENCGCSKGQTGGVQRRARIIEVQREEISKPLPSDKGMAAASILIDTGDFSDPFEEEKRILSGCVVQMMGVLKYDCVGIGAKELGFKQEDLLKLLSKAELPYAAANLTFTTPKGDVDKSAELAALVKPYRIVTTGGRYRVGVIHIIDPNQFSIGITKREGYDVTDATVAVNDVLAKHKSEAQLWLVTASAMSRHTMDLNGLGGLQDVMLVFGFRSDNPLEPEDSDHVVFPKFIERNMDKGKDITITKIFFPRKKDEAPTIDSIKTRVDDSYQTPESVMGILEDCKKQIEEYQLANDQEVLAHNDSTMVKALGPRYMGWQSCQMCHSDIVDQLSTAKHTQAYESLKKDSKELTTCMKCHSVGYMRPGGWNSIEERKFAAADWDRRDVQCENCHGPGEYHIMLKSGQTVDKLQKDGRNEHGLLPVTQQTCKTCHDGENDPHFDFKTYWPKIQHYITTKPGNKAKGVDEVPVGEEGDGSHANGGGPHVPGMGPPEH